MEQVVGEADAKQAAGKAAEGDTMGQYHELWSFDATSKERAAETIDHYRFGAGAKLGEQCYPDSPYAAAVGMMVLGPWRGRRLVVIGDYAEDGDVKGFDEQRRLVHYYEAGDLHRADRPWAANVSEMAANLLAEASGWTFVRGQHQPVTAVASPWREQQQPYDWDARCARWRQMGEDSVREGNKHVIASSIGEYIDPEAFGSPASPLSMMFVGSAWSVVIGMLACSDGRGGGDLFFEPAGRWSYSVVSMVPEAEAKAAGFTDVTHWVLGQQRIDWLLGVN